MIIDAHLHISDDIDLINMQRNGVYGFVNFVSSKDWKFFYDTDFYKNTLFFYGVHPGFMAENVENWDEKLVDVLQKNRQACVGEIGLDKNIDNFDKQLDFFKKQVEIAYEFKRPLAIHCVKAWAVMIDVLKKFDLKNIPVMIHGFYASKEILKILVKMGCFLSFSSKNLNYPKMNELITHIPQELLLIETDFILQDNFKEYFDKLNITYSKIAKLRGVEINDAMKIVENNAMKFMKVEVDA